MDKKLLDIVFHNLKKDANIDCQIRQTDDHAFNEGLDAEILLKRDGHQFMYNALIKNEIRNHQLQKLWELQARYKPVIVIAHRIFPKIKEALRDMDIDYIEANGNCYINNPDMFIYIKGNKNTVEQTPITRAFTKTGLRVIYQYLIDPNLINAPYREVAQRTGVATGTITYVKNELKELGFLIGINQYEEQLIDAEELFKRWVDAYGKVLKPTLHIQNYRFVDEEFRHNWQHLLTNNKTVWGGEPAANLYNNYLFPEILTIYTNENQIDLMKRFRLVPDPNGYIHVYEKFWDNFFHQENRTTHPYLTYADLLSTGNARCIETANMIYKDTIHDKLQRISGAAF